VIRHNCGCPNLRILLLWASAVITDASPPLGYYNSAIGKTGQELRQALHVIIHGHTVIPYSSSSFDTSDALKVLDEDPANTNNVLLIYAQRSEPKTNFAAAGGWNREHLWPNSYGLDGRHPAYSDLHNLRPEDENVNSARGNKYYDVSETNHASYRFPAHVEAVQCSTDFDSWKPPDSVKGDIARVIFYMDVRYEGGTNGEPDLVATEGVYRIGSTTNFMGRLSTLLLWHEVDPVDSAEQLRNDRIFTLYQHNRNPFVDHPEWVREIFWPSVSIVYAPNDRLRMITLSWSADFTNATVQNRNWYSTQSVDRAFGGVETNGVRVHYDNSGGQGRAFRLRLW
jgi:endonuclease I